jgi:autophagy-related protein 9
MVRQCTQHMPIVWKLGLWMYAFYFIWKCVQYALDLRRLSHIRQFYIHLLNIPDQDMQTVSWQDVVARMMALRDANPKTAVNMHADTRRFLGNQSKERLDAHDIANRLMRKDNYLIAMFNKDILDLSLPIPFLGGRQFLSSTLEWYIYFGIIDFIFGQRGQVNQEFLKADHRGILSRKLRHRFIFAGIVNLILTPFVLAWVLIVFFFRYVIVRLVPMNSEVFWC